MNISILSLQECINEITINGTSDSIVSIRSMNMPIKEYEDIDLYKKINDSKVIIETFDDVERRDKYYKLASKKQVQNILDWSMDKDNIIVHCTAGVSRSSAIAYLIACKKLNDHTLAVDYLNFNLHNPNLYVVQLGAILLGNHNIYHYLVNKIEDYMEKNCMNKSNYLYNAKTVWEANKLNENS